MAGYLSALPALETKVPDISGGINYLANIPDELRQARMEKEKMGLLRQATERQGEAHEVDMMKGLTEWSKTAIPMAASSPAKRQALIDAIEPYRAKFPTIPTLPAADDDAGWAQELADIQAASGDKPELSLGEIYGEGGQPQKGVFDKRTGSFMPMGSPKAKTGAISFTTAAGDTIEIGGEGGNAALSKTTQGQVQQKAINTAEMGGRIASIAADFKPEYQTLGTRFANVWRSGKAKLDPSSLGAGERKSLADYASFRSKSIGNVNRLLNELSGAAVSPQEAERLKAEVPNPGTGWFDGDDPVTFQAKMERIMSDSNAALARYRYYQSVGIPNNIEQVPLADVKNIDGVWHVKVGNKVYRIGEIREVQP